MTGERRRVGWRKKEGANKEPCRARKRGKEGMRAREGNGPCCDFQPWSHPLLPALRFFFFGRQESDPR